MTHIGVNVVEDVRQDLHDIPMFLGMYPSQSSIISRLDVLSVVVWEAEIRRSWKFRTLQPWVQYLYFPLCLSSVFILQVRLSWKQNVISSMCAQYCMQRKNRKVITFMCLTMYKNTSRSSLCMPSEAKAQEELPLSVSPSLKPHKPDSIGWNEYSCSSSFFRALVRACLCSSSFSLQCFSVLSGYLAICFRWLSPK